MFQTAFVIGDKPSDIELGRRVGATTFLVRTGYGAEVIAQAPGDLRLRGGRCATGGEVIERLLSGSESDDRSQPIVTSSTKPSGTSFESAEIKRQTAERCAEAIVAAARVITRPFGRAARCCCAGTAAAQPIASTWRRSWSAG